MSTPDQESAHDVEAQRHADDEALKAHGLTRQQIIDRTTMTESDFAAKYQTGSWWNLYNGFSGDRLWRQVHNRALQLPKDVLGRVLPQQDTTVYWQPSGFARTNDQERADRVSNLNPGTPLGGVGYAVGYGAARALGKSDQEAKGVAPIFEAFGNLANDALPAVNAAEDIVPRRGGAAWGQPTTYETGPEPPAHAAEPPSELVNEAQSVTPSQTESTNETLLADQPQAASLGKPSEPMSTTPTMPIGAPTAASEPNLQMVERGSAGERGIGILYIPDWSKLSKEERADCMAAAQEMDFLAGSQAMIRQPTSERTQEGKEAKRARQVARLPENLNLNKSQHAGHLPDRGAGGHPLGPIMGLPKSVNSAWGNSLKPYEHGFLFEGFTVVDKATGKILYPSMALEHDPGPVLKSSPTSSTPSTAMPASTLSSPSPSQPGVGGTGVTGAHVTSAASLGLVTASPANWAEAEAEHVAQQIVDQQFNWLPQSGAQHGGQVLATQAALQNQLAAQQMNTQRNANQAQLFAQQASQQATSQTQQAIHQAEQNVIQQVTQQAAQNAVQQATQLAAQQANQVNAHLAAQQVTQQAAQNAVQQATQLAAQQAMQQTNQVNAQLAAQQVAQQVVTQHTLNQTALISSQEAANMGARISAQLNAQRAAQPPLQMIVHWPSTGATFTAPVPPVRDM